jgi:hypothetical protein
VDPELSAEVSAAYLHYWQVVSDSSLSLDPSHLGDVTAGDQLAALQKNLDEDKAAGRAIRMDIQHNFVVVSASPTEAEVADRSRDLSIWVDPTSGDPLPGQVQPASPDQAPEVDAVLDLQKIDGQWKVVYAARAAAGDAQ